MIKFLPDCINKLLVDHQVSQKEVLECFANGEAIYLEDTDEEHRTDPPSWWFMAPTNRNRMLKVCFIRRDGDVVIKTAFEPSSGKHLELYRQRAGLPSCWPSEE
ncbi:hypothetical protein B0E46_13770 [Rhodanobacter sp. B04]|uniref:DUF4258 domain-containing protein n=1 Tax=Rhodanobacter sp. B04 TaxID=1945860 RepID=UPI000985F9CB|nr:DUF4258 domain-containing protein [Rhodanobacter sp. B04]OOG62055.1 hypothetical protein B0E46_13770 [Rhodanobacter sp. B04]